MHIAAAAADVFVISSLSDLCSRAAAAAAREAGDPIRPSVRPSASPKITSKGRPAAARRSERFIAARVTRKFL